MDTIDFATIRLKWKTSFILRKHLATANLVLATANLFSDSECSFCDSDFELATANLI